MPKEAGRAGPQQLVHDLSGILFGQNLFNDDVELFSGGPAQFALVIAPSNQCTARDLLRTHAWPLIHVSRDPIGGVGPFRRILVPSSGATRRELIITSRAAAANI
jgi:hypothetical protein